jgi:2-polyprenyl-6-methoxyphenol hydroxylase-like FAD-dependent oxidoreductase
LSDFDILIVGAGAAGASTAHVLSSAGLRVGVVDSRSKCAPCFKAEKLEPDQIALLERFGLLRQLEHVLSPLHEVVVYRRDSIIQRPRIDQFGMHYDAFVNALRTALPAEVEQITDTVTGLTPSDNNPSVELQSGRTVTAKLLVVAAGTSNRLRHAIGATRREIDMHHSIAFGFDLKLESGRLPHDGVNFFADTYADRIGFLTLFPTPVGVRANLFAYQDAQSDWARDMRQNTKAALERAFSGLHAVIGNFTIEGRVNGASIDLWTTDITPQPGVVLVGDSFQSVCPTTGTGLSKVLTDTWVLGQMVPEWFRTPGVSATKIAGYYGSADKLACDRNSLGSALYGKRMATDQSLRFRLRRLRRDMIGRWRNR